MKTNLLGAGYEYHIGSSDVNFTARYRYINFSLVDNASNSDALLRYSGKLATTVTLQGRKLWKDGAWNTLCLPFGLTADQVTAQLAPTELKELDVVDKWKLENEQWVKDNENGTYQTGFDDSDGTLYLFFKDASSIVAGKAYIIKWAATEPNYIENPVFSNVTISDDLVNVMSADGALAFVGTYSPHIYTETNKSILFLGDENTLYYPQPSEGKNPRVNACRAYFQLYGIEAGDIANARMNFEESETSGIVSTTDRTDFTDKADAWYTVNGVKLSGKPTMKGVYIHGGRKVVIK